jgi:hypothetical protein
MKCGNSLQPAKGRPIFFPLFILGFVFAILVSLWGVPNIQAADVTLSWDRNAEPTVVGYRVYYGTSSRSYSDVVNAGTSTTYVVTGLDSDRKYFFTVTAYDSEGNESGFSNEVSWGTNAAPSPGSVPGGSGGGCLIASAVYHSPYAEEVILLRAFRDRYLLTHAPGRAFVRVYEDVSPPLAGFIERHEILKSLTRWALLPIVYSLSHPRRSAVILVSLLMVATTYIIYQRRKKKKQLSPLSG